MMGILQKVSIAIFSFSLLYGAEGDLPEPYASLQEVLPFNPHGWYSNGAALEKLIQEFQVQTVIEVGSWLGTSTRDIASHLPPNGVVYAVDHWMGSVEHQGDPVLAVLYEQFLSNVIRAGLTHKIVPVRMDSLDAARSMQMIRPDLIYLDASHDTSSVLSDLEAWFPYVKGHGILCGDDWSWPSVVQAVVQFAEKYNLEIEHTPYFWRLIERQ